MLSRPYLSIQDWNLSAILLIAASHVVTVRCTYDQTSVEVDVFPKSIRKSATLMHKRPKLEGCSASPQLAPQVLEVFVERLH